MSIHSDTSFVKTFKVKNVFTHTSVLGSSWTVLSQQFKTLSLIVLGVKIYILYYWKVFMVIQGHISIGPMLK